MIEQVKRSTILHITTDSIKELVLVANEGTGRGIDLILPTYFDYPGIICAFALYGKFVPIFTKPIELEKIHVTRNYAGSGLRDRVFKIPYIEIIDQVDFSTLKSVIFDDCQESFLSRLKLKIRSYDGFSFLDELNMPINEAVLCDMNITGCIPMTVKNVEKLSLHVNHSHTNERISTFLSLFTKVKTLELNFMKYGAALAPGSIRIIPPIFSLQNTLVLWPKDLDDLYIGIEYLISDDVKPLNVEFKFSNEFLMDTSSRINSDNFFNNFIKLLEKNEDRGVTTLIHVNYDVFELKFSSLIRSQFRNLAIAVHHLFE